MTRPPRPLDFIELALPEARLDRQWDAIRARGLPGVGRGRPRARMAFAIATLAAACAAAALAWLALGPAATQRPSGAMLESAASEVAVRLEDGSQLVLAPQARLQLLHNQPNAIELSLRSGRARFAVSHRKERSFEVELGGVRVRVVGTRFEIERTLRSSGSSVRVAVTEGVVELRRSDTPGEATRLGAGETWSAEFASAAPPSAASTSASPPAPAALAPVSSAEAHAQPEPAGLAPEAASQASGKIAHAKRAGTPADAISAANERSAPEASASELFMRANLARRAGRIHEAADGYAALLARYPEDARAGLSAFELGRIRMDALADPGGALAALERAAASSGSASYHEDALARIVLANQTLGRLEACRGARDRYLARYPNGVHARELRTQCE